MQQCSEWFVYYPTYPLLFYVNITKPVLTDLKLVAEEAASLAQEPAQDPSPATTAWPAPGRIPLPAYPRVRPEPVTTPAPAAPTASTTASQNTAPQVSGRTPLPNSRPRLQAAPAKAASPGPAGPSSQTTAGARLTKTEREKEAARLRQKTGVPRPEGPCGRCRRAKPNEKWPWMECHVSADDKGAQGAKTCARCKFYKEPCGDQDPTTRSARRSAKRKRLAQRSTQSAPD